jgi:hypothetical protein
LVREGAQNANAKPPRTSVLFESAANNANITVSGVSSVGPVTSVFKPRTTTIIPLKAAIDNGGHAADGVALVKNVQTDANIPLKAAVDNRDVAVDWGVLWVSKGVGNEHPTINIPVEDAVDNGDVAVDGISRVINHHTIASTPIEAAVDNGDMTVERHSVTFITHTSVEMAVADVESFFIICCGDTIY